MLSVYSLTNDIDSFIDTVMDFSWEPKGERFAIVSSNDPNLGNPGSGVTIKTDVSFYQLDRAKNDFRLLRKDISDL
jgi:translation initiation factor 3 subunit B